MTDIAKKISKNVDRLCAALGKRNPDFCNFTKELRKIDDINAYDREYGDTLLSVLIPEDSFCQNKASITEAVRIFLENGYDVKANDGANGIEVLKALCYAYDDKDIIPTAKLLLDAGAPLAYIDDDSDACTVYDSIGHKLAGLWNVYCDYDMANTIHAYYYLLETYKSGKNYREIHSFHHVIGKTVTRVSHIDTPEGNGLNRIDDITEFKGDIVLWFGDTPLIVSDRIEMLVNPHYVRESENKLSDITELCEKLGGARLDTIQYADALTFSMDFDNGYGLIFTSHDADHRDGKSTFELRRAENIRINELEICKIQRPDGTIYSDTVTVYDMETLVLMCKNKAVILFSDVKNDGMSFIACSVEFAKRFTKMLPLTEINKAVPYWKDDKILCLIIQCSEGNLYVNSKDYAGIEVMLSREEINPCSFARLTSEEEKGVHMDFILAYD